MNSGMDDLINQLDSVESHIKQNNEKQVTNLEKQRLRNKIRNEEMDKLQQDYETNFKTDPEQVNAVSQSSSLKAVSGGQEVRGKCPTAHDGKEDGGRAKA